MCITVLIIEDNRPFRDILSEVLELEKYRVIQADDGVTALQSIQKHKPHIMIASDLIREMRGIDLLRIIKASNKLRTIPFILLSAHTERCDRVEAQLLGADAFVHKPLDVEQLLLIIADLVADKYQFDKNI